MRRVSQVKLRNCNFGNFLVLGPWIFISNDISNMLRSHFIQFHNTVERQEIFNNLLWQIFFCLYRLQLLLLICHQINFYQLFIIQIELMQLNSGAIDAYRFSCPYVLNVIFSFYIYQTAINAFYRVDDQKFIIRFSSLCASAFCLDSLLSIRNRSGPCIVRTVVFIQLSVWVFRTVYIGGLTLLFSH